MNRRNWRQIFKKKTKPRQVGSRFLSGTERIPNWSNTSCSDRYSSILLQFFPPKVPGKFKPALVLNEGFEVKEDLLWHSQVSLCFFSYDGGLLEFTASPIVFFFEARKGHWTETTSTPPTAWIAGVVKQFPPLYSSKIYHKKVLQFIFQIERVCWK